MLSEEETFRNQSSFIFFAYSFDSTVQPKPLKSTLTSLKGLLKDFSKL